MNVKNKYKVLIVGAGNIGALLDSPESSEVLTHAHACHLINEFSDFAFIENNSENAKKASDIWGKKVFSNFEEGMKEFAPQVISVCVPPQYRKDVIQAIPNDIKFLFMEKPLATNFLIAKEIVEITRNKKISSAVNYSRLYSNDLINIKQEIEKGSLGKLIKGTFTYSKGVRNNGSHLLRLATYLLGEVSGFKVLGTSTDYSKTDINVDLKLEFENHGPVYMLALDETKFSNIECYLYFEKARVTLRQFGHMLQVSSVREDPIYKDYRDFDEIVGFKSTDLGQTMLLAYKNILNHLEGREAVRSSLDDALKTEILLDKILSGI